MSQIKVMEIYDKKEAIKAILEGRADVVILENDPPTTAAAQFLVAANLKAKVSEDLPYMCADAEQGYAHFFGSKSHDLMEQLKKLGTIQMI